ncbi:MAG: PIN domain-containing protein [Fibrobacterota bacterium]
MKIFLDTNILLDVLMDREPHAQSAEELLNEISSGKAKGFVSGITIPNMYYVLHDLGKRKNPLPSLATLLGMLEVVPTSKSILLEAMDPGFKDYEDGIQHASALAAHCTHLVTRNTKDFRKARINVVTAAEMGVLLRL